MKKLNRDSQGRAPVAKKGTDDSEYNKRLAKGEFTFDCHGKPMIVKKANPTKLPSISLDADYHLDNVIQPNTTLSHAPSKGTLDFHTQSGALQIKSGRLNLAKEPQRMGS